MFLKRIFFVGNFLLCLRVLGSQEFGPALKLALEQSPEIQISESFVRERDRAKMAQRAQFLPSLSVSGFKLFDEQGVSTASEFGVGLAQTLLDPSLFVKNQIATEHQKISQVNLALEQTRLQGSAQVAWFKAWLEQQKSVVVQFSICAANADFARDKKRADFGLFTQVQTLAAENRWKNTRKKQQQFYENLNSVFVDLEKVLGGKANLVSAERELQELHVDFLDFELPCIEECLRLALENRQEKTLADNKMTLEQQNKMLAYAGYLPVIKATAAAKNQGSSLAGAERRWSGQAGVTAAWNFFDGGAHKFEAEAAQARKLRAENEFELALVKIKSEVTVAYNQVQMRQQDFKWQADKLEEDGKIFAQIAARQKVGLVAAVEFNHAHLALKEAQFAWLTTKVALQTALAELKTRCGNPTEWCKN